MPNAFVEKLRGYGPLDSTDERLLEAACHGSHMYLPDHDLICEGDEPSTMIVMLEGWACNYKLLPDGSRQIIAFLMPGDVCAMHVTMLAEMDHSVATLTTARIARIPRAQLDALIQSQPRLSEALWWTQLVDEAVLRATIVSMGRRSTTERIAHLLCELNIRMVNVGLVGRRSCEMPFTQIVLADAVGLTPVHTNRIIKKLRLAGALETCPGSIVISDIGCLAKIAGFDDNYLHRRVKQYA